MRTVAHLPESLGLAHGALVDEFVCAGPDDALSAPRTQRGVAATFDGYL